MLITALAENHAKFQTAAARV